MGTRTGVLSTFTKYNKVSLQYFNHGRKCLEEYESLLSSIMGRMEALAKAALEEQPSKKQRLSSIPEDSSPPHGGMEGHLMGLSVASGEEQDLTGFKDGENDTRDKAIEDENFLHHLAEALGDMAGVDDHCPTVHEWALAKN
jgi:hypothetical protein